MTFVSHSCDPKITYCITLNKNDYIWQSIYVLMYLIICRGVSVDEKGYIYVADSGNNRIQIFNPDGTFLRCFGRWGQVNIFLLQQTFFPCNIKSRFPIQVRKLKIIEKFAGRRWIQGFGRHCSQLQRKHFGGWPRKSPCANLLSRQIVIF